MNESVRTEFFFYRVLETNFHRPRYLTANTMPRAPEGRLCVLSHDPTSSAFNAMAVRVNGVFFIFIVILASFAPVTSRGPCVFFSHRLTMLPEWERR